MIYSIVVLSWVLIAYFLTQNFKVVLFSSVGISLYLFFINYFLKEKFNLKKRISSSVLSLIISALIFYFYKDSHGSVYFVYLGIIHLIDTKSR